MKVGICRKHMALFEGKFPKKYRVKKKDRLIAEKIVPEQMNCLKYAIMLTGNPDMDYSVDFTCDEFMRFLSYKLSGFGKVVDRVYNQRRKIYAHVDRAQHEDVDGFMTKNSVEWRELMELIDFAYEICSFVVGSLTGCGLPRRYDDIGDIRSLFRGLRNGERYSARKMQESGYDCGNDAVSVEISRYIDGVNSRIKETPDGLDVPLFFEGSLADVLG